jgi:hypothetical protein
MSVSGTPEPTENAGPGHEPDVVELGRDKRLLSPRARTALGGCALVVAVIAGVIAVSDDDQDKRSDAPSPTPTSATTSISLGTTGSPLSDPDEPNLPSGIESLPLGKGAQVPFWSGQGLVFGDRRVPWTIMPLSIDHVGPHAVVLKPNRSLDLVSVDGVVARIIDDASPSIAVDHQRGLVLYIRRIGTHRDEIVAWNSRTRAIDARKTFADAGACCDQGYAIIRGILPDGTVLVEQPDQVTAWNPATGAWNNYPLSGASPARVLWVGGDRMLVRDEHHGYRGLQLRSTDQPLNVGIRLDHLNEGRLSPDGRWLAGLNGNRPTFIASTDNLERRVRLGDVGSSTNVVNAVWETTNVLLLQVAAAGDKGDTILVRCRASTGACERVPGGSAGAHQLPDGRGITY